MFAGNVWAGVQHAVPQQHVGAKLHQSVSVFFGEFGRMRFKGYFYICLRSETFYYYVFNFFVVCFFILIYKFCLLSISRLASAYANLDLWERCAIRAAKWVSSAKIAQKNARALMTNHVMP